MVWVAVILAMAQGPAPMPGASGTWLSAGRLYTAPDLHIGVRPAVCVDVSSWGAGVTVQITTSGL